METDNDNLKLKTYNQILHLCIPAEAAARLLLCPHIPALQLDLNLFEKTVRETA